MAASPTNWPVLGTPVKSIKIASDAKVRYEKGEDGEWYFIFPESELDPSPVNNWWERFKESSKGVTAHRGILGQSIISGLCYRPASDCPEVVIDMKPSELAWNQKDRTYGIAELAEIMECEVCGEEITVTDFGLKGSNGVCRYDDDPNQDDQGLHVTAGPNPLVERYTNEESANAKYPPARDIGLWQFSDFTWGDLSTPDASFGPKFKKGDDFDREFNGDWTDAADWDDSGWDH